MVQKGSSPSKMTKLDKAHPHLWQLKLQNIHEDEKDIPNLDGTFQKQSTFNYFFNDISTLKLEVLIDERRVPLNIIKYIIFIKYPQIFQQSSPLLNE
ncbi:unnamed protein product [Paramecium octaurelia]|uniref:Uncharacterized protein n=1 Tax=Paramecium octaurelia TaxID=43137 RepID=A0A8S1SU14_PAROT|nr:unnamed protein product [Paramecium octaurelia]